MSDVPVSDVKVFISYRRAGTSGHTGRLFDALARRYGKDNVFMDVAAVELGRSFADEIGTFIDQCQVAVVLIGPGWLNAVDAKGRRRLDNPEDWVRVEIETAMAKGRLVIPVLVDGATFPPAADLPGDLAGLVFHQALTLADSAWDDGVRRLVDAIDAAFPATAPEPPPTTADAYRYDAYISYVNDPQDEAWVWDELVPRLERAGLRVAVSGDSPTPGVERLVAAEQGIAEAKRTVVVASPSYLRDHMGNFENVLAQTMGVDEGSYRVLPVTPPGAGDVQLPMRLRMLTVLDLGHPRRAERNLDRLIVALQSPLPVRQP